MLMIISLIFCKHDIFLSFVYFVVNIVHFVVDNIVCEVDVIANSLVLYFQFCSTLNKIVLFFIHACMHARTHAHTHTHTHTHAYIHTYIHRAYIASSIIVRREGERN